MRMRQTRVMRKPGIQKEGRKERENNMNQCPCCKYLFHLEMFSNLSLHCRALKCICGLSSGPEVGTEEGVPAKKSPLHHHDHRDYHPIIPHTCQWRKMTNKYEVSASFIINVTLIICISKEGFPELCHK